MTAAFFIASTEALAAPPALPVAALNLSGIRLHAAYAAPRIDLTRFLAAPSVCVGPLLAVRPMDLSGLLASVAMTLFFRGQREVRGWQRYPRGNR